MGVLASLKRLFGSKNPRAPHLPKLKLPKIDLAKRFEKISTLGQGSMSEVWRARDYKIGRVVCLKVLDKEKTLRFEARFPGLNRPIEGAILMAMHHNNVVRTMEYGLTTKGQQYIVMELIEGMGLNYLIDTRSAQLLGNRINFLCQAAAGLEYVHEQGYLHRDICPRNMMVTADSVLKLIDFGLGIPYKPQFCKPGNRTGSASYLAPELIKRQPTDHRVDLFALGVTAYETFTGELPWERADSLETLKRHINSDGRSPLEFRPDLHPATQAFLKKAIARDPRDRFQTAAAFREALEALPEKE
jgi:serine/threonine protein kinase